MAAKVVVYSERLSWNMWGRIENNHAVLKFYQILLYMPKWSQKFGFPHIV